MNLGRFEGVRETSVGNEREPAAEILSAARDPEPAVDDRGLIQ